jgi:hypothetical protein
VRSTVVLDPACGSGNFLYVALQKLLGPGEGCAGLCRAARLQGPRSPQVSVEQLRAIEINPYAYELAQVSVQIGYLQWLRDNGFALDRNPVLQSLEGFENADALLREVFKRKPKNLKEARQAEHETDAGVKGYVERVWPECDVIVSNPPFLGDKLMRRELGDHYVEQLREVFADRIPGQSDLCCYWFEKARALIADKQCKRAGLLATQGIRGGANREVLKRIKESGDIFWAVSDREWILAGANVHVSLIAFDDGAGAGKTLNGQIVEDINANLSAETNTVDARPLAENADISFQGPVTVGAFDVEFDIGLALLRDPNPSGVPNSDVVVPVVNGAELLRREPPSFIVDFFKRPVVEAAKYASPFAHVEKHVRPHRMNQKREGRKQRWWQHGETGDAMRSAFGALGRLLATIRVSKHRVFVWLPSVVLPDSALITFARDDDYFFGVLHSRFHEVWALAQGTQLREKESGFRYTPTTCFETFPFPPQPAGEGGPDPRIGVETLHATSLQDAISTAARELNALRENWLNPPEWTKTEILEFPGTVGGPWSRFITKLETGNLKPGSVATVRYPRLVPRDAECAAKLKDRTLTKLYNERPAWLDHAHRKLDAAVAAAYGWPADLADEEILSRLLALNLERAAADAKAAPAARKAQRAKRDDELL